MKNDKKCSVCDVKVTEENEHYKLYVETLEFLFPTVAADDDVDAAGQSVSSTDDNSTFHIVISTLSGESVSIVYNPDQTIMDVKITIEKELKTPCAKQCLLYNDTELEVSIYFKLVLPLTRYIQ